MTKLKLIRSGGFIGKTLSSETETDIEADEIKRIVSDAEALSNPEARDALNYKLIINDTDEYSIDITKIKSEDVKGIIENELVKNLKSE